MKSHCCDADIYEPSSVYGGICKRCHRMSNPADTPQDDDDLILRKLIKGGTSVIYANQPTTKNEAYDILHQEKVTISEKKNHDYGDNISELGLKGLFVRIHDKTKRLEALLWNDNENLVKDETIEDTLKDLSNYCDIAILLRRCWWSLPWKDLPKEDK